MKRADLADAFDWDGSLLNLWSSGTDASAWLRAMHALDRAFPCAFLIGGEPAPLPDLAQIELLATGGGDDPIAEFHADTPCPGSQGALQVFFSLDVGPSLLQATLHPLDVPDEDTFACLTRLLGILTDATGRDVFLCAESSWFESRLVYAVYRHRSGWKLA